MMKRRGTGCSGSAKEGYYGEKSHEIFVEEETLELCIKKWDLAQEKGG